MCSIVPAIPQKEQAIGRRDAFTARKRRIEIAASAAALLLNAALQGCSFSGTRESAVIAEIEGEPIHLARFDEYVGETLSGQPGGSDDPPGDELLSRLLDRFLDEELVIREAIRRGMTVSDEEASVQLRYLEGSEGSARKAAEAAAARKVAERSVLLRKFREEQVLADIEIAGEEIAAYYDEHREEFQQSARLVLRQILLDDEQEARLLREELARDPARFQDVAEERSLAPDAGQAAAYDEASLPPEVIESVHEVPEGSVSRICKNPEGIRIFLVEKRAPAREVSQEEATDQIQVLLMQERSRRAYEEALAALRTRAGVVIHTEALPFRYSE